MGPGTNHAVALWSLPPLLQRQAADWPGPFSMVSVLGLCVVSWGGSHTEYVDAINYPYQSGLSRAEKANVDQWPLSSMFEALGPTTGTMVLYTSNSNTGRVEARRSDVQGHHHP